MARPKVTDKYDSIFEYLENHIFKVKDELFELQEIEAERKKEWDKASSRVKLQKMKLDRSYEGLKDFRKPENER